MLYPYFSLIDEDAALFTIIAEPRAASRPLPNVLHPHRVDTSLSERCHVIVTVEAHEAALPTLLAAIEAGALNLRIDAVVMMKVLLIIEELFLNTVKHGLGLGTVRVVLEETPERVDLIYEDHGFAHDPFQEVDRTVLNEVGAERRVGGLGVLLIEGLATTARYRRDGETNRIELTFARARSTP
jgi:serine/threonine-protein kinase RsbW